MLSDEVHLALPLNFDHPLLKHHRLLVVELHDGVSLLDLLSLGLIYEVEVLLVKYGLVSEYTLQEARHLIIICHF